MLISYDENVLETSLKTHYAVAVYKQGESHQERSLFNQIFEHNILDDDSGDDFVTKLVSF